MQSIADEAPEAHARPGTGSTDFLGGISLTQTVPLPAPSGKPSILFASALYTHTEKGVEDAAPGLRWEASRLLALSGYVQVPVYQRVNGTQLVSRSQFWLSTTYKLP